MKKEHINISPVLYFVHVIESMCFESLNSKERNYKELFLKAVDVAFITKCT